MRIATVPRPLSHDPSEVADVLRDEIFDLCVASASEGAACVILGGGPLAGLSGTLGPKCPVPLVDGTQAAIAQLRHLERPYGRG